MKTLDFVKLTFSLCILSICILLNSCEVGEEQKTMSEIEIAELLQRGDKIQLGKEWDAVQNDYAKYKKALNENLNDNETKILLAKLFIKEARVTGEHGHYYPGALAILDDALDNESINPDIKFLALTTKAGVQLSLHEFQSALETGNRAIKMNPMNAQIYGVLVDANVELGNYEKAVSLMDRMISIKPDIRSYSRVAYLREIHGDVEGSIEAMKMAVKAGYPGYEETAWARLTLGDMYQQYGELEKAKTMYESILETRPDYPFAVGAIGDILMQQGQEALAEDTYTKAMNIIPEVGFYIAMAYLYKKQERQDELFEILAEIMIMLKDDTDSGHNMNLEYASLYLDVIEDTDMALKYAIEEYEKRPDNIDVNRMLAKIYKSKNTDDKVKFHLEKAQATGSKHPELNDLVDGIERIE